MRQTHKSIFLSHLYSPTYQIDLCSIHGLLTLLCLERSGTNQFKLLSSNHNTQKSTSTQNLKTFETEMPPLMQFIPRNCKSVSSNLKSHHLIVELSLYQAVSINHDNPRENVKLVLPNYPFTYIFLWGRNADVRNHNYKQRSRYCWDNPYICAL